MYTRKNYEKYFFNFSEWSARALNIFDRSDSLVIKFKCFVNWRSRFLGSAHSIFLKVFTQAAKDWDIIRVGIKCTSELQIYNSFQRRIKTSMRYNVKNRTWRCLHTIFFVYYFSRLLNETLISVRAQSDFMNLIIFFLYWESKKNPYQICVSSSPVRNIRFARLKFFGKNQVISDAFSISRLKHRDD